MFVIGVTKYFTGGAPLFLPYFHFTQESLPYLSWKLRTSNRKRLSVLYNYWQNTIFQGLLP